MPKIPLYNQGQGRSVQLAAGKLSPRADVGAFTAPGQALANLGESASQIAFQFGIEERKREDARVSREEYAKAFDELSTHVLQDNSTNVEDAEIAFNAKRNEVLDRVDAAGYSKRRSEIVKADLSKLLLQKGFDAKQQAFKRGLFQSGQAYDQQVLKGYETLRSAVPGTPQWDFTTDALREAAKDIATNGIPTQNTLNAVEGEILNIKRNNTRSGFSEAISAATSKEQLDAIEEQVGGADLTAPTMDTLRNQIKAREVEISNERIASIINSVPIENVGDTQFDTVEEVEAKIEAIRAGNTEDEALNAAIESLTDKERIALDNGLNARLQQARASYTFKEAQREKNKNKRNEELYTQGKDSIMAGDENAIQTIRDLPFEGVNGESLREQLIDFAGRRARGEILTDSKPAVFRETQQKMWKGEIQSVDQRFVLSTDSVEVRNAGGKSIIERQGNQFSDKDAAYFETYLSTKNRQDESDANAQYIRNMKRFDDFLTGYKDKIIGNPAFAKLNLNSDSRFYDFSVQMRERFEAGIEAGKNPRDLLNPRHPDFIITPDENWTPTTQELMREISDSLKANEQIPTLEQVGPPRRRPNMSRTEYLESEEYRAWLSGPNYPKWLALIRGE